MRNTRRNRSPGSTSSDDDDEIELPDSQEQKDRRRIENARTAEEAAAAVSKAIKHNVKALNKSLKQEWESVPKRSRIDTLEERNQRIVIRTILYRLNFPWADRNVFALIWSRVEFVDLLRSAGLVEENPGVDRHLNYSAQLRSMYNDVNGVYWQSMVYRDFPELLQWFDFPTANNPDGTRPRPSLIPFMDENTSWRALYYLFRYTLRRVIFAGLTNVPGQFAEKKPYSTRMISTLDHEQDISYLVVDKQQHLVQAAIDGLYDTPFVEFTRAEDLHIIHWLMQSPWLRIPRTVGLEAFLAVGEEEEDDISGTQARILLTNMSHVIINDQGPDNEGFNSFIFFGRRNLGARTASNQRLGLIGNIMKLGDLDTPRVMRQLSEQGYVAKRAANSDRAVVVIGNKI